jgi:hypothetical protein
MNITSLIKRHLSKYMMISKASTGTPADITGMKRIFILLQLVCVIAAGFAVPLSSATWEFHLDVPEGLEFVEGDGRNNFVFQSPEGVNLTIQVYPNADSAKDLAADIQRRLKSTGQTHLFTYDGKQAALLELRFQTYAGWGLVLELNKAKLLALAYGQSRRNDLQDMYMTALNSIAPSSRSRLLPGPIIEFRYPRTERQTVQLFGTDRSALVFANDAEAAQALVEQEFAVLSRYQSSPLWKDAWIRFYRMIHRDSFDRLTNITFILEREWRGNDQELVQRSLDWVQTFNYERDLEGSDFVNLVSAATEGRGDCDSRALLWAILLEQADIPAAMMVSAEFSHAMGLGDIPGAGARFPLNGTRWLVAETTVAVDAGRIAANISEVTAWIGVAFE